MEVRIADCPLGAKCEEVKTLEGKQVLFRCPWYVQLRGASPQTGNDIDEWACAVAWSPVLQIEVAKEVRQSAAATESLRNEIVARVDALVRPRLSTASPGVLLDNGVGDGS